MLLTKGKLNVKQEGNIGTSTLRKSQCFPSQTDSTDTKGRKARESCLTLRGFLSTKEGEKPRCESQRTWNSFWKGFFILLFCVYVCIRAWESWATSSNPWWGLGVFRVVVCYACLCWNSFFEWQDESGHRFAAGCAFIEISQGWQRGTSLSFSLKLRLIES